MPKKPKPKRKNVKRGPKELTLTITADPQAALDKLLNKKPTNT